MRRAAFAVLAALVLAGCGGSESPAPEPSARGGVHGLDNVLRLRSDFEADVGKTRVLLLLSPT